MIRHLVFLTFIIICFVPQAHAGKVVKVKDKKIYILFDQTEGGTFAEGDLFTLTDADGKKRALVQIKKVKGVKAIALLKKGKADKGYGTVFKSAGKSSGEISESSSDTSTTSSDTKFNRMKSHWGAMFGYGSAGQDVDQGDTISTQSGSSMAIRGVYDYPLLNTVTLRGMGGLELFSVSGTGKPNNSTALSTVGTDVTYLALDGIIKWSFAQTSSMNFYAFAGAGFFYPMTKSSDVILEDSIEQLAVGEFGAGFDLSWGKWAVPIEFTYYFFPAGEDVKTSLIALRLGIVF